MQTYFLNTLAFNIAISVITFVAVWASKRKGSELTLLRGIAVLLFGWVIGSILVFILHFVFSIGGAEIRDGPLEGPISILVVLSVMYTLFGFLSKKRSQSEVKA